MTESEETVTQLLKSYFKKRNEIDIWAYSELERIKSEGEKFTKAFELLKPKLDSIYHEFLTKKERKRTLSYNNIGSEPKFDPLLEQIESVETKNRNRIIVSTLMERNDSKMPHQYVFLKENGTWRLDNRKTYWAFKEKWESAPL